MEALAFIIGLDPILGRGQQVAENFRLWWRYNLGNILQLREELVSFETNLTACIERLRSSVRKIRKLRRQSHAFINTDITSLDDCLSCALAALRSINERLGLPRIMQFFLSILISWNYDILCRKLEEAGKIVRDSGKHVGGTTKLWSCVMEDDGYVHRNLCRHLIGARRGEEAVSLLLTPQWTRRQLEVNNLVVLEKDFSLGIQAVRSEMIEGTEKEYDELEESLQLVSDATRLATGMMAGNFDEFQFQMYGRLGGLGEKLGVIREYVDRIEREESGPQLLCLNNFLVESGGRNTLIIPVGSGVECMALFNDGDRMACGCWDGRIVIVNVVLAKIEEAWNIHDDAVYAIAVTKSDNLIVSGSGDGTAKVLRVASGDCITVFRGHTGRVAGVAVTENERHVVSVSNDCTSQIWDIYSGEVVSQPFTDHRNCVNCVAILGDEAVTGGHDKVLRIWKLQNDAQSSASLRGHKDVVTCACVTPDGRRIVSGSRDHTVSVWDTGSHNQIGNSFQGHTDTVTCVAVSGDGSRIVSGSADSKIRVWDSSGNQVCDPLEGHALTVEGVFFLGSNDSIVSCSRDKTVRLWNIRRKEKEQVADWHKDKVSSICFTPNGKYVVSGSWDHTLRIWESSSGRSSGGQLEGHSSLVTGVAVTSNGQQILSVADDGTVAVWDVASRKLLHKLTSHSSPINCVAVTPRDDHAVTGTRNGTMEIWDLTAVDQCPHVFEGHNASVRRVFAIDSSRIVSVDQESNILVWQLETRNIVKRARQKDAWRLSKREVLSLVGETTLEDNTELSIPLRRRQIFYGGEGEAKLLATTEIEVTAWALSPDQKTVCVGLRDGKVGLMKFKK